jgi:hypothetical protein
VVIQADANDGAWTGGDGSDALELWQPLSWMGSAWRAVSDPSVGFVYAVNPFMVGNLADTPFDRQSAILQRGLRGPGCHYIGNGSFIAGQDDPILAADADADAGPQPQFLALAPTTAAQVLDYRGTQSHFTGLIPPLPDPDAGDFGQALGKLIALQSTVPLTAPWTAPNGATLDGQTFETWKAGQHPDLGRSLPARSHRQGGLRG